MQDAVTKAALARRLGISRGSLYYRPKLPEKDWALKQQIEEVLHRYAGYGHKRIAPELHVNKKRVLRVMKKFGIKPYRRRPKKPRKKRDEGTEAAPYQNLLLTLPFPDKPHFIWVKDFTYLLFHGRFVYLATVMDLFTRMVVGWHALTAHTAVLVKGAFLAAVSTVGHAAPYCHSDQGSEYTAAEYIAFVQMMQVTVSMSRKGCPWENGYQESFYSQFKLDLGDPNRFETLGELIEEIAHTIHGYNHARIHTALRMPPMAFARQYELQRSNLSGDNVSKEMGA
jgi:transposase InsO family protein